MRLLILFAVCTIAVAPTLADERVPLPKDYRETFFDYLALDRTQNPDQFIRLYANAVAMQGKNASGELPDGSILVGEVYSVKKDDKGSVITSIIGRRISDQLKLVAVMEKQPDFAETPPSPIPTGDWDFAAYTPSGDVAAKNLDECRACHAPLMKEDFVFSIEHFPNAKDELEGESND